MAQILIIDDDVKFLKMFRQMLERAGHDVVTAPNGEVGMKLFREDRPDLIITDIFMPEKEGVEIIRELKKEFPAVKIIVMSGGGRKAEFSIANAAAAGIRGKTTQTLTEIPVELHPQHWQTFHLGSFDLDVTLTDIEAMLHIRAEHKGLALVVERTSTLPRYIRTDEYKLRQVLINLLSNTIKFTEYGKITLCVKILDARYSMLDTDIQHPASSIQYPAPSIQHPAIFYGLYTRVSGLKAAQENQK